jgi:hypothetical protein
MGYDCRDCGNRKPPRGCDESSVPERSGGGAAAAEEAKAVLDRNDSAPSCRGVRRVNSRVLRRGPRLRLFPCGARLGEYILVATSAGFQTAIGN